MCVGRVEGRKLSAYLRDQPPAFKPHPPRSRDCLWEIYGRFMTSPYTTSSLKHEEERYLLRTPVSLVLSLCQMCLFWNNRIWACDWGHETWPGRSTAWAPSAGWTMIMIVWLLGREGENKIQFCLYCTVETKLSRYWQRWNWVGIYGGLDIFIWIYFYTLATLHPAQPCPALRLDLTQKSFYLVWLGLESLIQREGGMRWRRRG